MTRNLLIEAEDLAARSAAGECLIIDCRFDLRHPGAGRNSWLAAHIPGSVYAHLDDDLSGRVTERSGRHPLPKAKSFASFLAAAGWREGRTVVACDAHGGAYAARLWWLMHYFGLGNTVLLNGGIAAWKSAMLPMESGEFTPPAQPAPVLSARREMVLTTGDVARAMDAAAIRLVDAREEHRFAGESEPIDLVAGHIPGALNHPYICNVDSSGRFRSPADLRAGFRHVARQAEPGEIVHMCGSGVTACQNIFSMELAGIAATRLYAGSWSEWIRNPSRPVALGDG